MQFRKYVTFGLIASAMTLLPGISWAADKVTIGVTNAASDIALFIADAKGYFAEEDLVDEFVAFDSVVKMIAPLGAGHLDVGGGAASAGFYNALDRDVEVRIVADKARNAPGFGFQSTLVRKDLMESGEVKSWADLKDKKVAIVSNGSSDMSVVNEALKSVGLNYDDVEITYLGFAQQLAAYENSAIDASITTEPHVRNIVSRGAAEELVSNDSFYPNAQTAVIFFGSSMLNESDDRGVRFMKAYIRAANDYVASLKDGAIAGEGADEIINIMAEKSNVKDHEIIRKMTAHQMNTDGSFNVESLEKDLTFFKKQGLVKSEITVDGVSDSSFIEKASEALKAEGRL